MRRKSAPTAPSIARWSHVSVIVISGTAANAPSLDDDALLARADGEDRDLRRVEHGDELLDAEHAEVRDRERAALEVVLLQLVVARALHEVGARAGDLGDAQALGVADHRDDETLRRGDGDADVRARVDLDLAVDVVRVDVAVAHERRGRHARQHVGDGRPLVRVQLAQPLDERERLRHVGRDDELEDGRLPSLREPARDRLADARELSRLDLSRVLDCGHGRRGRLGALDVLGDDPPVRAGALDLRDVDAALARDPARQRRRLDPAAVSLRDRSRVLDRGPVHGRCGALALRGSGAFAPFSEIETSSPCSPMTAIVLPTSTSPSSTAIFSRTPDASASTSCVTLSVSSS